MRPDRHHRRRGAARRSASTCCIALNSGLPGMCTHPRQQCARGASRSCARCRCSRARTSRPRVRRADGRGVASTSSSTSASSTGGARRVREIVARARPGRERRRRDRADSSSRAAAAGARRRVCRRTPSASPRAGIDLAALLEPAAGTDGRAASGSCSASGCCWSGWSSCTSARSPTRVDAATGRRATATARARPACAACGRRGSSPSCAVVRRGAASSLVVGSSQLAAIAVAFGADGGATRPSPWSRGARRSGAAELREVWPEVVDNLASAVRAGLSLPEALAQLGGRGPDRCARPFAPFARDYQRDRAVRRVPRPAQGPARRPGRRPRRRGAAARPRGRRQRPRPAAAQPVGVPARGRAHPRRAETRQGWTVNGGAARGRRAVARAAAAVAASPEAVAARTTRRPASSCCAVGGACLLVAYRVMMRIGRLPDEQRVLR